MGGHHDFLKTGVHDVHVSAGPGSVSMQDGPCPIRECLACRVLRFCRFFPVGSFHFPIGTVGVLAVQYRGGNGGIKQGGKSQNHPDAGCRMPDAGCRMPDAGCSTGAFMAHVHLAVAHFMGAFARRHAVDMTARRIQGADMGSGYGRRIWVADTRCGYALRICVAGTSGWDSNAGHRPEKTRQKPG